MAQITEITAAPCVSERPMYVAYATKQYNRLMRDKMNFLSAKKLHGRKVYGRYSDPIWKGPRITQRIMFVSRKTWKLDDVDCFSCLTSF